MYIVITGGNMGGHVWKTGDIAPVSGIYRLVDTNEIPATPGQRRIPLAKGKRFPPCRGIRHAVYWRLEMLA